MNLQHNKVVRKLDIAAFVIVSVITLIELIISHGIFCQSQFAMYLLATRVGITLDLDVPFKTSGSKIPWNPILVTLAVIVYIISVLVENKDHIKDFLPKLSNRTSQINQAPEELQSISRTTEAQLSQSVIDEPAPSPLISNPEDPQVQVGLPRIFQVAAYHPSALSQGLSVNEEVELQPEHQETFSVAPSSLTEDRLNVAQLPDNGEHPVESFQETPWKAYFLIASLTFTLGFISIVVDMKNGLAVGVMEKLLILAYYCLPFYLVILIDECFLVSKRIVRTWLSDHFAIYFN